MVFGAINIIFNNIFCLRFLNQNNNVHNSVKSVGIDNDNDRTTLVATSNMTCEWLTMNTFPSPHPLSAPLSSLLEYPYFHLVNHSEVLMTK